MSLISLLKYRLNGDFVVKEFYIFDCLYLRPFFVDLLQSRIYQDKIQIFENKLSFCICYNNSQQQQQYKIEQVQKPSTKVPQLDLKLLKISPFPQSDIDSERDDFPMLFDEDDEKQLLEQLKQLGEIMKQKRQQQISLERQIAQNKYLLALMRVMIKGIYLYDVNEQNQEFDSMMNELHYRLEQDNLGDIKIRLMTFNKEHAQLNQMYQSLEQSERVVEQIKSQINLQKIRFENEKLKLLISLREHIRVKILFNFYIFIKILKKINELQLIIHYKNFIMNLFVSIIKKFSYMMQLRFI